MEFKTLEDQEAARLVLRDAHANGTLGYGQYYRVREDRMNLPDLLNPICPIGHLKKAGIVHGLFRTHIFDDICLQQGMQAGFEFAMNQVDEANIGNRAASRIRLNSLCATT